MRLLICCPNWRHLGLECHRGLLQVACALEPTPDGWGVGSLVWGGVTYEVDFLYAVHTNIPFAREYLVDAALDRGADYSLHVDADTGFELEHVFRLVEVLTPADVANTEEAPDPIVGATLPIPMRHAPHHIAAFPLPMTQTFPQDWWKAKEGLVDVAGCGMGIFAFTVIVALALERPLFPVFDNRFGEKACPVDDIPMWLHTPLAKVVGSDVGFTSRLAANGRVVILMDHTMPPCRHVVEVTLAPFERTVVEGCHGTGGPGAGRKTL